jgi:hypothetical protein
MAMMLIALLAVVLPALQTETAQTATMQSDVDRLARAAEGLEAAANNRGAIAELEMWLTHDDRHLRDNVAFVLRRLDEAFLFAQSIDATSYDGNATGFGRSGRWRRSILAFAERVLPRASDLWVQASLDYKQRLQQLFFPERDRVRRNSIQSNRRNGTTFLLLGAV